MSSEQITPIEQCENPIITAHRVYDGLEKDANDLVEKAGREGEIRKDLWKTSNLKKSQEQKELSALYAQTAYLGIAITLVSAAAGALTAAKAFNNRLVSKGTKELADVISGTSSNVSRNIIDPFSQNLTQRKQANIDGHNNNSQDFWAIQQDITTSRKEQLQNVKRGVNDSASASIGKLGECMATR